MNRDAAFRFTDNELIGVFGEYSEKCVIRP